MQHGLALRATARSDGLITIHVGGVLDSHTLDRFEAALAKALERGAKSIVVDCEDLRYVSSAGFGELIRYFDRLKSSGGLLVLARVAPKVGVILEMLGLRSLIPVVASLEEGVALAERGADAAPTLPDLEPEPEPVLERGAFDDLPTIERTSIGPLSAPAPNGEIACPFCDARLSVPQVRGRGACVACGAPFERGEDDALRFEWADDDPDCEGIHLTIHASASGMAAFAGLIEGLLTERRVAHAAMRRFAREAVRVCMMVGDHAYGSSDGGLLHILATAGEKRLVLRLVDRGRGLEEEAQVRLETPYSKMLEFSYATLADGLNVTRLVFVYAGAGVFAE